MGCSSMERLTLPASVIDWHSVGLAKGVTIVCPSNSYVCDYIISKPEYYQWEELVTFATEETDVLGDTNGNGTLDISDVTIMQKKLVGIYTNEIFNYDVNGDGKLNIWDATIAQRKIAKIVE